MHVSYRSGGTQPACPTPLPHNRPASYIDFRKVNTLYRSVLRWKTVPPAARTPPTAAEGAVLGGQESDSRKQCEGGEERMVGSHWLLKRQVPSAFTHSTPANMIIRLGRLTPGYFRLLQRQVAGEVQTQPQDRAVNQIAMMLAIMGLSLSYYSAKQMTEKVHVQPAPWYEELLSGCFLHQFVVSSARNRMWSACSTRRL
ncbi:hypothetical protein FQA47_008984 [Oryzias melastigma]|uniref:Uncharacterized protein n=2 Tax=Percomorphaceae TaxID=1489872 RepID=A0A834F0K8_ORYME|nr:hypothetical protein FQA47_008984 [Oryzias melastigma]